MLKISIAASQTKNWWLSRHDIERTIMLSCLFSVTLIALRVLFTGSLLYSFLVFNLFLATMPYMITSWLVPRSNFRRKKIRFLCLFIVWLLLIPNSFYVITDLFHLEEGIAAPKWFNLVILFSLAWNGVLLGIISLRQMEKMIFPLIVVKWRWTFVYLIMWLNAIGIYLGRYLRFNSWDIVTNPFQLASDILYLGIHPFRNFEEWSMIGCYMILMIIVYESMKKMGRFVQ